MRAKKLANPAAAAPVAGTGTGHGPGTGTGTGPGTVGGPSRGRIVVRVVNATGRPIVNASVVLFRWGSTAGTFTMAQMPGLAQNTNTGTTKKTGLDGTVTFVDQEPATYIAYYNHFTPGDDDTVYRHADGDLVVGQAALHMTIAVPLNPHMAFEFIPPGEVQVSADGMAGDTAVGTVVFAGSDAADIADTVAFIPDKPWIADLNEPLSASMLIRKPGFYRLTGTLLLARRDTGNVAGTSTAALPTDDGASLAADGEFEAGEGPAQPISGNIGVSLTRTETEFTPDLALWTLIRNSSEALGFNHYMDFLDELFCTPNDPANVFSSRGTARSKFESLKARRALPFTDSEAYRVLKAATEAFVMVNCGVLKGQYPFVGTPDNEYLDRRDIPFGADLKDTLVRRYLESVGDAKMLPYLAVIRRKLPDVPILPSSSCEEADLCFGIIQDRLTNPCLIELLWSYWQEEGMLVQTMNVITQRFQNLRSPQVSDPLANTEIDALRPLNNLLWGYTQDEQHRLTVVRRNYEYDHHYGVRLDGKAVRNMRPADSRSKFLEAFHHLLRLLTSFYKQDDDTTVKADAFPILNALKEVHLILSEGAHNQYGDLPSTARIEMLMQQWLLARPEFREFLPTRVMVAYPEPWMDRVDAMKKLQLWSDTSVMHFRNLAIFGEQLLLSIRFGHWSDVFEATQAFNWARFWRPQAQGYIHAYRAATGVDLSVPTLNAGEEATLPSVLLRQRLAQQQRPRV